MAKKNKKSKKWVFWLILFLLAGIFYFFLKSDKKPSFIIKIENIITSFLPGKDLTQKSLKIDQAVIRILDKLGVEDRDVLEEYREEKKAFGKTWIQINRKISISNGHFIEDYQLNLTREASQFGASVTGEIIEPYKKDIQFILTVHINDIIFQKIILLKKYDVKKN